MTKASTLGLIMLALIVVFSMSFQFFGPVKPPLVPAGSWNSGNFLKPGYWYLCQGKNDLQLCQAFDSSGTARIFFGQYVKISAKNLAQLLDDAHSGDYTSEFLDSGFWYKKSYLVPTVEYRYGMDGGRSSLLYRDVECLRKAVSVSNNPQPPASGKTGRVMFNLALRFIHENFPNIDLTNSRLGKNERTSLSLQEYLKKQEEILEPGGEVRACGARF